MDAVEDVDNILEAIARDDPVLSSADLTATRLSDSQVAKLASGLANNTNVTALLLEGCDLKDHGVRQLAEVLRDSTHISDVVFRDNGITDEGARAVCDALQFNTSVVALDMSFNDITSEGARCFGSLLRYNTKLSRLGLGCNQLHNEGLRVVCKGVLENDESPLETLLLDNNGLTDPEPLVELIKTRPRLSEVDLQDNQVGDSGATKLSDALKATRGLTALDLSNNGIGDDGLCILAVAVAMNKDTLKKFDLRKNKCTARGERALAGASKHKPTINFRWRDGDTGPAAGAAATPAPPPADPAVQLAQLLKPAPGALALNSDEFSAELEPFVSSIMTYEVPSVDTPLSELPPHFVAIHNAVPVLVEFLRVAPAAFSVPGAPPGERFGLRRARVAEVLVCAAEKRLKVVDAALVQHGFVPALLDAFFAFPMNNILHNLVHRVLTTALKDGGNDLASELMKADFLNRLVAAEESSRAASVRPGYLGHIVVFSNALQTAIETVPAVQEAAGASDKWREFVAGALAEANTRNETVIGGTPPPRMVAEPDRTSQSAIGNLLGALGLFGFGRG